MNKDCIAQVAAKIGRNLSKKEQEQVVATIRQTQAQLARSDINAYRAMSQPQRVAAAADQAAKNILQKGAKQKQSDRSHLRKTVEKVGGLKAQLANAPQGEKAGAMALLADIRKVEVRQDGLQQFYFRDGVLKAIEAIPGKAFGFLHDMESMESFVRHLYDGAEASPQVKAAVKAWNDTAERLRVHANNLGMDIGKLDYSYLPQLYDVVKMQAVKADEFARDMVAWMDKGRFVDENGAYIGDAALEQIVMDSRDNIITNGLAGRVEEGKSGVGGKGGIRGKHEHERVFHFANAEAHLAFAKKYGQGNLLQAMSSHVHSMARDIAMMEHYGPKAPTVFGQMLDVAKLQDGNVEQSVGLLGATPQRIFDSLAFGTKTLNAEKAQMWQAARNIQSAAKLAGAVLSSFTDTIAVTGAAWQNGMPARQVGKIFNDFVFATPDYKKNASRMGIIADSVIGSVNRWADGEMGYDLTSRMTDATFRMSGLNAWTDGLKRAFSVNLHITLGDMTRASDWGSLHNADRYRFEKYGITPEIYDIWRASDLEQWDAHNSALSPEKIMELSAIPYRQRVEAASMLIGYVKGMENIAVNTPDLIHKGRMSQFAKGDTGGEIARSMMQFKSFPATFMSRQLDMIADIKQSRGTFAAAQYTTAMLVGLSMAGALSVQAKQLVAGRDPLDMQDGKFWLRSTVQGGGLGFFGDLLYTGLGAKRQGDAAAKVMGTVLGPLAGSVVEGASILTEGLGKGADGVSEKEAKDTAARLIRFVGSNVPVAPMDLWYTRTAIDRLIVDHLQEWASPGWSGRQRGNIKKEYGQEMWWQPTDVMPKRAPDLSAAIGE